MLRSLKNILTKPVIPLWLILYIVGVFEILYRNSFRPHCGPGVDSVSIRNDHKESSWWLSVRRADNIATFICRLCKYPGCLNLFDASEATQTCRGTVLAINLNLF
jgi:hypothetical protein